MLAIAKIREDLVEVRYYYTRKKVFDEANESVGINMILGKVKKYNEAMRTAPPLLYDLYVCLYTRNYNEDIVILFTYAVVLRAICHASPYDER